MSEGSGTSLFHNPFPSGNEIWPLLSFVHRPSHLSSKSLSSCPFLVALLELHSFSCESCQYFGFKNLSRKFCFPWWWSGSEIGGCEWKKSPGGCEWKKSLPKTAKMNRAHKECNYMFLHIQNLKRKLKKRIYVNTYQTCYQTFQTVLKFLPYLFENVCEFLVDC